MKRYKNILVALNLTEMDKPVIQFASIISNMTPLDNIYHLHIDRKLHIPEKIRDQYPELQPLKEISEQKIKEEIEEFFNANFPSNVFQTAIEGNPVREILNQIANRDIDLVIIGRKTNTNETRMLPIKVTRKAPCSVLVVPEGSVPSIKNILVPIDFSENSSRAMDVAIAMASSNANSNIHFLHVYELPIGYSKTGKSEKEFGEIMKSNAQKAYLKFIDNVDFKGVSSTSEFILHPKPAEAIRSVINKGSTDMVILGARGLSESAGLLLGSVTENLILSTQVPLIAVKKKGEGMKFLEALFKYI